MVAVAIVPVIVVVIHPAVAVLDGYLVATSEAAAVLVAIHSVCRRPAEHHRTAGVEGALRLPVIVRCIHAVMEGATADVVVKLGGRDIPARTLLIPLLRVTLLLLLRITLLLLGRPAVLLRDSRGC